MPGGGPSPVLGAVPGADRTAIEGPCTKTLTAGGARGIERTAHMVATAIGGAVVPWGLGGGGSCAALLLLPLRELPCYL